MRIEITRTAKKDLIHLDEKTRQRLITALEKLLNYPESADVRKLGEVSDTWRLRVGVWRVIFQIDEKKGVIYVLCVKHRREAYRD